MGNKLDFITVFGGFTQFRFAPRKYWRSTLIQLCDAPSSYSPAHLAVQQVYLPWGPDGSSFVPCILTCRHFSDGHCQFLQWFLFASRSYLWVTYFFFYIYTIALRQFTIRLAVWGVFWFLFFSFLGVVTLGSQTTPFLKCTSPSFWREGVHSILHILKGVHDPKKS